MYSHRNSPLHVPGGVLSAPDKRDASHLVCLVLPCPPLHQMPVSQAVEILYTVLHMLLSGSSNRGSWAQVMESGI
jgi:hypothetical protein